MVALKSFVHIPKNKMIKVNKKKERIKEHAVLAKYLFKAVIKTLDNFGPMSIILRFRVLIVYFEQVCLFGS